MFTHVASPVSRAACTLSMASRAFSRAISIGVDEVMRCTPIVKSPTSGSRPMVRMNIATMVSRSEKPRSSDPADAAGVGRSRYWNHWEPRHFQLRSMPVTPKMVTARAVAG